MRYTSDTTPSTAHVSRAGLDPSDFGAVAAVTWTATVAATNDRAFADATAAALAQKKNLTVSPGIYPINRWIIDAPGTNNLEIRAYGATLLASNQLTDGVAPGDALMEVKSSIGKPNGEDFARRISIFGLNVMSGVGIHAPRVQRAGIRLFAVQDIVFRDVWVSGFYYSGLTLDTVYDSTFESVSLVEVGSSAPTGQPSSMNRYGLEFTTSLDDNCNAIRFFGLRIEHAPLLIRFAVPESYDYAKHSPGHRQIDFFGLKAEQGAATNWSELALLNFGHCTGIHFHGGGVVRSQWERVGQQENPYTVESAAQIVTAENPLKVVTFSHVEFNTPGERAMLVARGSHLVFDDCTFQDVASVAATRPVFDLVDTSRVVGGTLRFARTMSDQPGLVPHANLARFSGRGSQLRGLAVSVPAGLHGTELRVEASAVENVFVRGSVSGAFTIPVDASATPLDGRLTMYEISGTAVLSSPAPSVFGLCWAELLSGVYLGFEHGTRDQVITLLGASGQSVALFTSATLRLRDGVSRTLRSDEAVTLRRCAGFWAEVG